MIDTRTVALDRTIARMRDILDAGQWPTGDPLTRHDRELIEWNLALAREQRAELRLNLWRRQVHGR